MPTSHLIHPIPLNSASFSPFGSVISSPLPPSTQSFPTPLPSHPNIIPANQNTALKTLDVSPVTNDYLPSAPSRPPAKAVTNMFSCFPRPLRRFEERKGENLGKEKEKCIFDIKILERHPYTTQTFIPLTPPPPSSSPKPSTQTRYLIIVAPTLPSPPSIQQREEGPPDLDNIQAFWAHSGQAVTYGPGTWHAPMVVVGSERIDFVVVQYVNGVKEEDCQEVDVEKGVAVVVSGFGEEVRAVKGMRAKL
ncbi:MAG: hypothetical protein Q9220_001577 [cf. Caloplaca sp. 1 TL-2023]